MAALQFKTEEEAREWLRSVKAAGTQSSPETKTLNELLEEPADEPDPDRGSVPPKPMPTEPPTAGIDVRVPEDFVHATPPPNWTITGSVVKLIVALGLVWFHVWLYDYADSTVGGATWNDDLFYSYWFFAITGTATILFFVNIIVAMCRPMAFWLD